MKHDVQTKGTIMKILATDLDRTLLPNGRWEPDSEAIHLFNQLTEQHDIFVVYVTGRNLELTQEAIQHYGVRPPHVLCGDVGTSINHYASAQWRADEGWVQHVTQASPAWDAKTIRNLVAEMNGLEEQEPQHQNQFKQSYYVDHDRRADILREIDIRIKGKFDEAIIYSYDSQENKGLIDFLPNSATKRTALEYVADARGCPKNEVVFCGDSGNDIFALTAGFLGVLVRNADEQLVASVKRAMEDDPSIKAYFAQGNFKGLSGYYTSGVIEGAYHYGLFNS